MERFPYIGKPPGVLSFPNIPLQAETTAYLGRFSGANNAAYKNALNEFIFRCKSIGVWSLFQDLWLHGAPTQADALRNLISASRDATLTGTPTYSTASGFTITTGNTVNYPFSTTGLTTSSGFLYGARLDLSGASSTNNLLLLGSTQNQLGSVSTTGPSARFGAGVTVNATTGVPFVSLNGEACICGVYGNGSQIFNMTGLQGSAGPTAVHGSPTSAFKDASVTTNRMLAVGFMPTAPGAAASRKLSQALQKFFEDLGMVP